MRLVICENCNGALTKEVKQDLETLGMNNYCPKCGEKI